ncbi:MAG: hypothetical protein COA37_23170 [Hoeflea sp.]|nr:MAG: hypothetical protein COA37_23170 [Hoeflea sp.]
MADPGRIGGGNIQHQSHDDGNHHQRRLGGEDSEGKATPADQQINRKPGGDDADIEGDDAPPSDRGKDQPPEQPDDGEGEGAVLKGKNRTS